MDLLRCCTPNDQQNFQKEKDGYRCVICGKFYPFLQIKHGDELIDPKKFSKPKGKTLKYKKSAVAYLGDHYYAQSKNTLVKLEIDGHGQAQQSDMTPIMSGVYHIALSPDEKYAMTETFGGTLAVVDLCKKEIVAQKRKHSVNGAFIFTNEQSVLYFYDNAIRCWSFLPNTEAALWSIPPDWVTNEAEDMRYNAVCTNVIYNPDQQSYLFQLSIADSSYIVAIHHMQIAWQKRFNRIPTHSKLIYSHGINQYTLSKSNKVTIYDGELHPIRSFLSPSLLFISDGGGVFPITKLKPLCPDRVYVSGDGKWILLNFFTSVIVMRALDLKIQFCLFSYTGKAVQKMGFTDDSHFWYTWGDTTYIQEIVEE